MTTLLFRGNESGEILDADGKVIGRVVPVEPSEAQWGGLARDIVMWMDMGPRPTPEMLFKHLERIGRDIPQWLRDEPEMQHMNHVPSKGTRAVIIYHAMLSAATLDLSAAAVRVPDEVAAAVRRCLEIVRKWEYHGTYVSDAIKAEFPEAFPVDPNAWAFDRGLEST